MQNAADPQGDLALIARAVARDARAVEELHDRHGRLLFNLILRVLRDRGDAEDVLQEAFLSVWTRAETYNPALGSPVAWLVRIARNRAIDRLRANAVRARAVEACQTLAPADPPAPSQAGDEYAEVARALDTLPAGQRVLIEHAYYFGMTHSELAARFSLPLGTVKTRVRNGLMALRRALEQMGVSR